MSTRDIDTSESPDELASARFYAGLRAEPTPTGVLVLSDPGGHWFFWRCSTCGAWESQGSRSKAYAQQRADRHAEEHS